MMYWDFFMMYWDLSSMYWDIFMMYWDFFMMYWWLGLLILLIMMAVVAGIAYYDGWWLRLLIYDGILYEFVCREFK
jgi:hypothetical protein